MKTVSTLEQKFLNVVKGNIKKPTANSYQVLNALPLKSVMIRMPTLPLPCNILETLTRHRVKKYRDQKEETELSLFVVFQYLRIHSRLLG